MPIRTVGSTLLILPKNEERYVRIGLDSGGIKRKSLRLMMQENRGFTIVWSTRRTHGDLSGVRGAAWLRPLA
ncbi:hypothetical protein LKB41_001614 [Salmonella enterica]|nr:hypothetical protein [Salmonella enterica]HCM1832502.1 hypothetical protein [Salmonella enterica subsp. salamae serovar 48:z81:z39]HCM1882403.1 hypothetical protein [Salmonella enterica subsp. salamae serovar 60:z10:z39]EGR7261672.1 hypothetical protein [Salmonella enterica]EGT8579265.1 hypothetical protein [Salmonella enterica]